MECTGEETAAEPRHWRVGAAFQHLSSELDFDQREVGIRLDTVAASLEWRPGGRFAFQIGAGAVVDGTLDPVPGAAHDVAPGLIGSLAASWTVLPERGGAAPFVSAALSLGFVAASTTHIEGGGRRSLVATDARLSAIAGKTLFGLWTPYLVVRGFAGPVFWSLEGEEVTGGDQHHFQIGVGSVLACLLGFDLLVEWAPLGARGLTAGAGFAF